MGRASEGCSLLAEPPAPKPLSHPESGIYSHSHASLLRKPENMVFYSWFHHLPKYNRDSLMKEEKAESSWVERAFLPLLGFCFSALLAAQLSPQFSTSVK